MKEYETLFVTQPDLDKAAVDAISDRVKNICSNQAHLLEYQDWGVRRLAYEIRKQRKGHYFQVNYMSDTNIITELERNLKFDEQVVRFLTVVVGEVDDVEARIEEAKQQEEERQAAVERRAKERAAAEAESASTPDESKAVQTAKPESANPSTSPTNRPAEKSATGTDPAPEVEVAVAATAESDDRKETEA